MEETREHLKQMISVAGLSGHEAPIHALLESAWQPLTDEQHTSRLGSLHALKRGRAKAPRNSLAIVTHMDAIGLMVKDVDAAGLLHLEAIGGIDARVLPGQLVTLHARGGDLPGVIVIPPAHALPEDQSSGVPSLAHLRVDTGLRPAQARRAVQVGDLISFATLPQELDGDLLVGHSLDNRACVAVLTETLRLLQTRTHAWDVWAVATVQEEITLFGALTSGYALRPTLAVVIDVTFAKSPGAPAHKAFEMNKGPALDWGPNTHPRLYKEVENLARRLEIPIQPSVYAQSSGTDAILLQVAAEGIPTAILSIPLRYMHTPVEIIHTKDIERAARLLAEFISGLDDAFMEKLRLDTPGEGEAS
ncbi:MAG: M20/M25/M40 family metallo-hydrolase [Chloroflexi bacterium]|nr:M20/M25/M40 family metallo-hydrolase [Chloroflexota bacterium]